MKINDKIELTAEQREALEKKETRNQVIETAITVGMTITGFFVARHFSKKLNAELEAMKNEASEEDVVIIEETN